LSKQEKKLFNDVKENKNLKEEEMNLKYYNEEEFQNPDD